MDTNTEKLIRENAEVEHALLAPFRLLIKFIKVAALVIVCIIAFAYNSTAWVVGYGSMGLLDREHRASLYATARDEDNRTLSSDYYVYFANREDSISLEKLHEPEPLWMKGDYTPPSGIHAKLSTGPNFQLSPDYCSATARDDDPGMRPAGWFNRTWAVFLRKSSRMREAYITGGSSMSALRMTLTALKMHLDPHSLVSLTPGEPNSLCRVDPFNPWLAIPSMYNKWVQVSASLDFTDAPFVNLRLVHIDPTRRDLNHTSTMISGMCLVGECTHDDLDFYSTTYADLFASTPPLSADQEHAVNALNALQTDAFWLQEAHRNGVYDDAMVISMAQANRIMIASMIAPEKAPISDGGYILGIDENWENGN